MTKTIATIDLKNFYEIYLEIKNNYPKYGERFLIFLAACQYFDPDLDLMATLKLRSYGGLIGIDNHPDEIKKIGQWRQRRVYCILWKWLRHAAKQKSDLQKRRQRL